MAGSTLTAKQERFVQEYLLDLDAGAAAIRAGYSPKSAASQGSRMLKDRKVQKRVDQLKKERAERTEVKADEILRELMRIGFVDPILAFDDKGLLRTWEAMPESVRRAVASVETTGGVITKLKFWSKPDALKLLGQHLKLFTEKHEHSGVMQVSVVDPYAEPPKGGQ